MKKSIRDHLSRHKKSLWQYSALCIIKQKTSKELGEEEEFLDLIKDFMEKPQLTSQLIAKDGMLSF